MKRFFRDNIHLIFGIALVLPCLLAVTGCAPLTPPPSTQPINSIVTDYYAYRGGYVDALEAGIAARTIGKLSDKQASDLETWRTLYLVTTLSPEAALAQPLIDPSTWSTLQTQQMTVEQTWLALITKKS